MLDPEPYTCHGEYVLYYLVCIFCDGETSKTGKTNNFRKRMNCHISESRTGVTTDVFDLHVHNCMKKHNRFEEPYFKIYAYFEVSDPKLLIPYEDLLHSKNFDSVNKQKV